MDQTNIIPSRQVTDECSVELAIFRLSVNPRELKIDSHCSIQKQNPLCKRPSQSIMDMISIGETSECWENTARKDYPYIQCNNSMLTLHRLVCALMWGPIHPKLDVHHTCDNPKCLNPFHLVPVTHRRNLLDAAAKGKMGAKNVNPGCLRHNAKLSDNSVIEIRKAWLSGQSCSLLAKQYGVSRKLIRNVATRKTWRHVA